MIDIRPFTDNDFDDFYAIRREALIVAPKAFSTKLENFDQRSIEVKRKRYLDSTEQSNKNRMIVGAWVNGAIKGMIGMARFNETGFEHRMTIWGVFRSSTALRKGLGSKMMQFLFDEAAEIDGVSEVVLSVMKLNSHAIHLYEKLGMTVFDPAQDDPILQGSNPEEELFMVYHLTTT